MNVIGTYAEVTKDFRAVRRKVKDSTVYYSITATHGDEVFDVLWLSTYNPEVDDAKKPLRVSSRDFASDTAFHLNAIRFLLVPIAVEMRGIPKFMLEPGRSTRRWVRTGLGVATVRDYLDSILANNLGKWLTEAGDASKAEAKAELEVTAERVKALEAKVVRVGQRKNRLARKLKVLESRTRTAESKSSEHAGDVGRMKDDLGQARTRAALADDKMMVWRRHALAMRGQLIENNIEIRDHLPSGY